MCLHSADVVYILLLFQVESFEFYGSEGLFVTTADASSMRGSMTLVVIIALIIITEMLSFVTTESLQGQLGFFTGTMQTAMVNSTHALIPSRRRPRRHTGRSRG